jgi:hypothetical protein
MQTQTTTTTHAAHRTKTGMAPLLPVPMGCEGFFER